MVSTLYKALSDIGLGGWAFAIVVISLFVDITPGIKFNPVKFIFKSIGDAFNKSVNEKIDEFKVEVNEKIDAMDHRLDARIDVIEDQITDIKAEQAELVKMQLRQERSIDESEINRLKSSILTFSNRLSKQEKFTLEEYRTVMDQHTQYEKLIDKYADLKNGRIDIEYRTITRHYEEKKECGEYMF